MRRRADSTLRGARAALRRALPLALALAAALLLGPRVVPAPANAIDLFPVDDWLGAGLRKTGDVVLGGLKLGAEQIAKLLVTIVATLADLLVPKSFVRAGLNGVRWLVQPPAVGATSTRVGAGGTPQLMVAMPHVGELRSVLTWIGVAVLPLGLVLAGGRAILAPSLYGESPTEIVLRTMGAALGLVVYDWAWGLVTELSRLSTGAVLGLPWVDDGVERMLETLLIGGAAGTAVASEFVIPLLILGAGGALLALLLLRVGLEVVTALLYVTGGLVLGVSMTGFGRRLLAGWAIAAAAVLLVPLSWSVVFVTGAALMLDSSQSPGGGLGRFVAQLYNAAAALATFWVAIKLARGVFARASGAIGDVASSGPAAGVAGQELRAAAQQATPQALRSFSQRARQPLRHPLRTARVAGHTATHPVQSTHDAASALRDALTRNGARITAATRRPPDAPARPTSAPAGADRQTAASDGTIDGAQRRRGSDRAGSPDTRAQAGPDRSQPRTSADRDEPARGRSPRSAAPARDARASIAKRTPGPSAVESARAPPPGEPAPPGAERGSRRAPSRPPREESPGPASAPRHSDQRSDEG